MITDDEINFLVGEIKKIREKNNDYWMELVAFAFRKDPQWARDWQRRVRDADKQITKLSDRLAQ